MRIEPSSKVTAVISEIFTNLAAGYFGTIIIYPGLSLGKNLSDSLLPLILNLFAGIVMMSIAIKLKD